MAAWFSLFFLAPIIIIIIYSFLKKGLYGGVEPVFSMDAYRYLGDPAFADHHSLLDEFSYSRFCVDEYFGQPRLSQ